MTTKFRYNDEIEKNALIARALSQKPRVEGVVATEKGWVLKTVFGTEEVLVSFKGLDKLLAENTDIPAEAPSEQPEVAPTQAEVSSAAEPAKKKGGRPPKAAVSDAPAADAATETPAE